MPVDTWREQDAALAPLLDRLRGLDAISNQATGRGVTVAMIDSGWARSDTDHRVVSGLTFTESVGRGVVTDESVDEDHVGHGTTCTRLLLSAAPDVRVIPLRVFTTRLRTSARILESALLWCVGKNVKVVNLSLGSREESSRDRLYRACHTVAEAGIVIVAAAGPGTFPATFDNVLSVGTGGVGRAPFQYFEDERTELVLGTAGTGPIADLPIPTSYAAAKASALVARMLETDPNLTLSGVRARLRAIGQT